MGSNHDTTAKLNSFFQAAGNEPKQVRMALRILNFESVGTEKTLKIHKDNLDNQENLVLSDPTDVDGPKFQIHF